MGPASAAENASATIRGSAAPGELVSGPLFAEVLSEERGRSLSWESRCETVVGNLTCIPCSDDIEVEDGFFGATCVCRGLVNGEEYENEEGVDYYCLEGITLCMYLQVGLQCLPVSLCIACGCLYAYKMDDGPEIVLLRPCSDEDVELLTVSGRCGVFLIASACAVAAVSVIPLAIASPLCVVAGKPFNMCYDEVKACCQECLAIVCNWRHCSCTLCRAEIAECSSRSRGYCGRKAIDAVQGMRPSHVAARCATAGGWCMDQIPCRTRCLRLARRHAILEATRGVQNEAIKTELEANAVEWMRFRKNEDTLEVRMAPNTPLRLRLASNFPRLRVFRSDLMLKVRGDWVESQMKDSTVVEGDLAFVPDRDRDSDEPAMVTMPDNLEVGKCLMLYNVGVATWGANISARSLCIVDRGGLMTALPPDLQVSNEVFLRKCSALAILPSWTSTGPMNLGSCGMILRLPDSLQHVRGDLILNRCTSLVKLPDNLTVDGNLVVRGCAALQALPENLTIKGDLIAADCGSLAHVPSTLVVRGNTFDLTNCASLLTLPLEPLMMPRTERLMLNIQNTRIVGDELDALRAVGPDANVMVFLGNDAQLLRGMGATVGQRGGDVQLSTLFDVAREFNVQVADLEPHIDPAYMRGVLHFLSMLLSSEEFKDEKLRGDLKERVREVLDIIAQDPVARDEIVLRMLDATDACADKPIWALGQMQLVAAVTHARGDRARLRKLGRGIMRLNIVHEHVERFINAERREVDDVCVYLRFEIDLRETLDLPVSSKAMIYARHVPISMGAIAVARRDALAVTEKEFDAWLAGWPEWQRQGRMEAVVAYLELDDFDIADLTCEDLDPTEWADLKGEPAADPAILLPNTSTVWSYNDLCERWVATGMDFANTALSAETFLANTRRLFNTKPQTRETPQRASLGRRDSLRKRHLAAVRQSLDKSKLGPIPERGDPNRGEKRRDNGEEDVGDEEEDVDGDEAMAPSEDFLAIVTKRLSLPRPSETSALHSRQSRRSFSSQRSSTSLSRRSGSFASRRSLPSHRSSSNHRSSQTMELQPQIEDPDDGAPEPEGEFTR